MGFRDKLVALFSVAVVILAVVGVLSYRKLLEEDEDHTWVEHTYIVLGKLDALLINLSEEHRVQFLESRNLSLPGWQKDLTDLRHLTSDNPSQQRALDRLDILVSQAWSVVQDKSSTGRQAETPEGRKRELIDHIRSSILEMQKEEQSLLARRLQSTAESARRMKRILIAGNLAALALLVLAGTIVQGEIGKRERGERDLRTAEERYHVLFDSNPLSAWVYDLQSLAIVDVNAKAISQYGYSREEFLNRKITDLHPSEDTPGVLEAVAEVSPSGQGSGSWRHRKKSGQLIDVEIKSYPVLFAEKSARLVVALDVTERKRAETELRRSEERFRLMVSSVKDYAILMLDPQGHVISWNAGAERIKGYREEEILGQHFSRFYPEEDLKRGKPQYELEVASQQGRFEDEGWRIRKDGSRFWANVVITALRDESGQLRGFGKVTRDVTERKRVEEQVRIQNAQLEAANKELEAFSYSVSHDLRSPLRSIDGFSQALLEDCAHKLESSERDYLDRIRAATQRMGTLIDDLLNLSRVARAELHKHRVNLSALADSISADLRKTQPDRNVTFQIAAGVYANGDAHLLRIVLENLLGNAWKFTSKHPSALIEFGRAHASGSEAYFVRDNGAGFDPAHASKLFGAFQRLHGMAEFPGTGVGLATVQRIIHRHGGEIWAESAVEKGATFYFTV
jgi:PAS domain S-box-containing protein